MFLCFFHPNKNIISAIENIINPIIGSIPSPNKDKEPILIINGASKQCIKHAKDNNDDLDKTFVILNVFHNIQKHQRYC